MISQEAYRRLAETEQRVECLAAESRVVLEELERAREEVVGLRLRLARQLAEELGVRNA